MNLWKRLILVLLIGSFPFATYYFSSVSLSIPQKKKTAAVLRRNGEKHLDVAIAEMNRGVETKAKELRDIDVKILENKGAILKLEEDKRTFVSDLEAIRTQISTVIKDVKQRSAENAVTRSE